MMKHFRYASAGVFLEGIVGAVYASLNPTYANEVN